MEEVLFRKKFDRYLSLDTRIYLIQYLLDTVIFVVPEKHFSHCRDKKDNVFLDVAFAGKADYIVTGDEDLLVLAMIEDTSIISAKNMLKIIKNLGTKIGI